MDFFESQDVARRNTGRLVLYFVLAVIAIVTLVYLAVAAAVLWSHSRGGMAAPFQWSNLWDLNLLLWVGLGTVILIASASLFKMAALASGGGIIAESLGGRPLDPNTANRLERRLLNVVEEMAIASGTPVPPVYLLDDAGINAFAAGFSPDNAVIGVTRGAIQTLSRDEMQGVIAHEFSHILNGDMRLNIRLIGIVHGILIIGLIGYFILRSSLYSGRYRSSRRQGNPLPLIVLGLALIVIGYAGMFFGNLIKAAISRQREYLADAAAVQFTRNPHSIAGALKKIGGWVNGSTLETPKVQEISHMLFGPGVAGLWGAMFATHPPLVDRIRRITPSFDGEFPEVSPVTEPTTAAPAMAAAASAFAAAGAPPPQGAPDAVSQIGRPTTAHLAYAAGLIDALPTRIKQTVHEPFGARAVVYALLINTEPEPRDRQLTRLAEHADRPVYDETKAILPLMEQLDPAARLPLVDMAVPALRALSPKQYEAFGNNVDQLVKADQKMSLFEWT
ncbi:MAG: M48 family metallopeptidase, partial [Phycisphaeraceae bacterium]